MDKKNLQFALPDIGDEESHELLECLRRGWLTTGPKTALFEKGFADYLGMPHALAVNSGTAGLHLALEALGIRKGDIVITSAYTFTACAEVIRYLGAHPALVDIERQTFNLDPQAMEGKLEEFKSQNKNVKAVLPVHFAGQACDMESVLDLSREYGIRVIEDAAHALPCTHKGRMIGTIGDATVFSFYVTKPLSTGEGGMVVTASERIAKRMKIMRLHGIDREVWDRYTSKKPQWYYEVVAPGFKYNMPDLMAAIGIHQLKKINQFQSRREEIAIRYNEAFADLPLRTPRLARPEDTHAWHLFVIQLELENIKISRDRFIERMAEKGIGTSVHFIPLHLHPYWRDRYGFEPDDFPVALDCYRRAVSLPIYSKMTDDDVERVIKAVKDILV
jgi:dTDP-4-amino-4,6-dideoxygalactose transaminase